MKRKDLKHLIGECIAEVLAEETTDTSEAKAVIKKYLHAYGRSGAPERMTADLQTETDPRKKEILGQAIGILQAWDSSLHR